MRALILLLTIASCTQAAPATRTSNGIVLDNPTPGPADMIAAIGAQALCADGQQLETDRSDGVAVHSCAP